MKKLLLAFAAGVCLSACAAHGLDVREDVEKMLVVDYLMANFDRHWNNFGVLIDSESREWLRAAPVFDTGESLWCDRELSQPFDGYTTPRAGMMRPFARKLDELMGMQALSIGAKGIIGVSEHADLPEV